MLPLLLMLVSGAGTFTLELGPSYGLDGGIARPRVALQPTAAVRPPDPGNRDPEPVVAWRDDRLGPWTLTFATPGRTEVVAVEREGELRDPQVTSTDDAVWLAWEVGFDGGATTVRACRRGLTRLGDGLDCPLFRSYDGARLPRFRVDGHLSPMLRMAFVFDGGGFEVDPSAPPLLSPPEPLPTVPADAVDFAFADSPTTGVRVFAEQVMDGGAHRLLVTGMVTTFRGTQPNLSPDGGARAWVDEAGQVQSAGAAGLTPSLGARPWVDRNALLFLTESGGLAWRMMTNGQLSPPTGSAFVDHAPWLNPAQLGEVGDLLEFVDGAGQHDFKPVTVRFGSQVATPSLTLLSPSLVTATKGASSLSGDWVVGWRGAGGLELRLQPANGQPVRQVTRTGPLRDFALAMQGPAAYVLTASQAGVVSLETFSGGVLSPAGLSRTLGPATAVALASNGTSLQVATLGGGALHLVGDGTGQTMDLDVPPTGRQLRADCLARDVCAVAWDDDVEVHLRIAPAVTLPAGHGRLLGLAHTTTHFVVLTEDSGTRTVSFFDVSGMSVRAFTVPSADDVALLSGPQPVLVWQSPSVGTLLALQLDTVTATSLAFPPSWSLREGFSLAPGSAVLLFDTLAHDVGLAQQVGIAFEPLFDAGVPDGGSTPPVDAGPGDAGVPDGGQADGGSADAGPGDAGSGDAGTVSPTGPTEFALCGCSGAPALLAVLVLALLRRRR